jgi:putative phosphoesterase
MVEIAIGSDTHVPSRAEGILDWVADRVRAADHVIHAGDFDSPAAYERVADLADGDLTAVLGNTDPLALDLPEVAVVELSGTTFVVAHGTGSRSGYRERVAGIVSDEVDGPAFAVAGHTHEVIDEDVMGIHLLNPGSATRASPATAATVMTVEIGGGSVDVTVYEEDEEVVV